MGHSPDDYTVAWICALPLEMTAAKLMLDKVHASLPQPKTDYNTYTLGSVGGHNVVVACLPSGVYGTTSAAIVLAHMLPTFPSLRFALMVGIGGGVPESADIRLGDVVVSLPSGAFGGVVQYDYGKTLRDGSFQCTGSLNKPPQYLLTAISQIRSDAGMSLEKAVEETLQKHGSIREQFSRPSKDWLFEATYNHSSENADCSACDQSQLVDRKPRKGGEPFIHYGLIASGNQVMKNAQLRDSIAQQIGALCFEMEAAGLMDQLPCLVIRGICDYCDSHKHKEWQGYAAFTAAAYAAYLLHAVPVTETIARRAQNMEFTEEEKACLRSLFITDPKEDKNSLKRRKGDRASGTCSWIFDTDELQNWLGLSTHNDQQERSILWLYGNPGTGKSTMAITLSEELPSKPYFQDGSKTIAYFFCDSSSDVNRTAISVLRGLLYQLIKQYPAFMQRLLPIYKERGDRLFGSFDALWDALLDIARISGGMEFYYIIDALDECEPNSQETLLEQIHQTFGNPNSRGSSPSNMYVLITSRPYYEIRRLLSTFRSKDLATYEAVASDLRKVIQEKVNVLSQRNRYPKALVADISRVLEEKAEGTFLWVGIACDELAQVQSRNSMKALQALPRGLNSLYQKLLETAITTSGEDDEPMILEMLTFVAFALRPLTLVELSEACQLYPDEEEDCRLQFTQEVIDLCRLMIVVQGSHVRLLHKSVKDFLLKGTANINNLQANAKLAHRCLNSVLQNLQLKSTTLFPDARDGFLNYAAVYWPQHANLSETEFTVIPGHESFFFSNSSSWSDWIRHYNSLQAYFSDRLNSGFLVLHAAARWDIPQLIQFTINGPNANFDHQAPSSERKAFIDSDFKTADGVTPLMEAARYGRICIMKILLERGSRNQPIEPDVMKSAAQNTVDGLKVTKFLLDQYVNQIKITEDIIKVVSQNHPQGTLIVRLLLEQCKEQIQANTHLISTIIQNFDVTVVKFLLTQCEERLQITEGMIEAAAQNYSHGNEIMILILERYNDIQENSRMVSAIIQSFDEKVVRLILNRMGNRVKLSDELFKAAARNYRYENIIFLLLNKYGEEISITMKTAWPGVPYISDVQYNCAQGTPKYNSWRTYAAKSVSAVEALVGYWRCMNREAGERYWNVPFRRNPNFVAQNDEITKIKALVLQHTVPVRIVVCGRGGVGKTQFALELAYHIREHDPEYSIFWISSHSTKEIERSYLSVAKMLGFYDMEPTQAELQVNLYLSQKQAGKNLLVFDDAQHVLQLAKCLIENEQNRILITTRRKNVASMEPTDVTVIDLSNPSINAALQLLKKCLVDKSLLDDQETATSLVQHVGLYPLAITQIAGYINREKINLSQLLHLLEQQRSKRNQKRREADKQDMKNYSTTLSRLSERIVQGIRQNLLAAVYLSFMACMNPDDIPQSLLPPAKPKEEMEALSLLKDSSVIRETKPGYFAIHRFTRNAIRDWMKSTQEFQQQILKTADRLSEVFPNNDYENQEKWRQYLPHAMSLFEEVVFQEEQAKYISLVQRVGHCLYSDERYSEAAILFRTNMAIQKNGISDMSYSLLSSMSDLARTYNKLGQVYEAMELEEEMVELSKRVLATEYPDTLEMIRQRLVLQHLEKHEKGETRHGQKPEGQNKAFELEHPDTLHYFSLLGLALDRQGRHKDAENMHRLAFGGLHTVLGPKDYYTLTGIFSLAYSLLAQDKKEDAFTLLEIFIELRGKSLDSDQLATEDASYCLSHWEDYYRMRLHRKQQQEQRMISSNEESQHSENTSTSRTMRPREQSSANPAQKFIQDHPLLRASRSGQSIHEGHDLQEVD